MSRKLAAEFLGTLFLLATVVGSGIMGERMSGGNPGIALLGNTLATGAMLTVLIIKYGHISGAHFNPAVTLAFLLRRELPLLSALAYWGVQIVGAFAGVWLAHAMFDLSILQVGQHARSSAGQWLAEGVATFGLVATILGVLRAKADYVGFAVGLYISAGYWFTASTSFANPAVTLARGFTDTFAGIHPEHVSAFVIAQLVGAIVATYLFFWLLGARGSDSRR